MRDWVVAALASATGALLATACWENRDLLLRSLGRTLMRVGIVVFLAGVFLIEIPSSGSTWLFWDSRF